jgi:hypothetical protein
MGYNSILTANIESCLIDVHEAQLAQNHIWQSEVTRAGFWTSFIPNLHREHVEIATKNPFVLI